MKFFAIKLSALAIAAAASFGAHAVVWFDQNVTNNVITGSGIANGGFTVDRVATGNTADGQSIEIGLRARERYGNPIAGVYTPTGVTGSNGNGSYNQASGGFTPAGGATGTAGGTRAGWNFDWSINTRASGVLAGGAKVSDYTYRLGMDFNAGFGTNYQTFDLINGAPLFDHSFGDFSTGQGLGVEAANAAGYSALKSANELVQNSWNYDFFDGGAFPFDPTANGQYSIFLEAIGANGAVLARSDINVIVGTGAVPEPASLALVGLALAGLAAASRRKAR